MLQTHIRSGIRLCHKFLPSHPVVSTHLAAAAVATAATPSHIRAVQTASMAGATPAVAARRRVRGVVFDMDGEWHAALGLCTSGCNVAGCQARAIKGQCRRGAGDAAALLSLE